MTPGSGNHPPRRARFIRSLRLLGLAIGLYVRAAPAALALRLTALIVAGLGPVAVTWFIKAIVDRLSGHRGGLTAPTIALATAGGAIALAQHLTRYADQQLSRRVTAFTTARLFEAVNRPIGIAELEDPAFHDRLRLAQQAAQSGPQLLSLAGMNVAQSAITVAGFLATLLAISPPAAGLVLVASMPVLVAQLGLARRRAGMQLEISPRIRRQMFYSMLMVDVRAAKEIRLFGLGSLLRRRMLDELGAAQDGERAMDKAVLRVDSSGSLLTAVVSGIALIMMVRQIPQGNGTIGDVPVLIGALTGVQGSLAGVIAQVANAGQVFILLGQYRDITAGQVSVSSAAAPPVPVLREGIVLRDLWFRYHPDQPWVLRGLDLTIRAGTSVAIVGLNGAGKSTLVKLLCRMYEPTRGTITWDGVDIREFDVAQLRARIGVLFQDFMAYDMTAAENIAVGDVRILARPEAEDAARLSEAARVAGLHETLTALPDGYQTMLSRVFARPAGAATGKSSDAGGPVGAPLSGGQWQRLALARAVLRRDTDLLVLDEPSSGLDASAEQDIHTRLVRLRAGRTSLLISHRLSTVRDADLIAVVDGGRVSERGTHDSLLRDGGTYATLFRTQAAGYQLDEAGAGLAVGRAELP
jgi:ATP-binding cassette subfamily B protein